MKSIDFWKKRYSSGQDSGSGSAGFLLEEKTKFLNDMIDEKDIKSVLDFGHGDLRVAKGINVKEYTGIDIFDPKDTFGLNVINSRFDQYDGPSADAVICLDVLYHILENEQDYMTRTLDKMMEKSNRFVIIYAQDSRATRFDSQYKQHLYNSKWFQYMEKQKVFELVYEQKEPFDKELCSAQFFVFERKIMNEDKT